MKLLLISILCVAGTFSAPVVDEDVRILENNDIGNSNEIRENVPKELKKLDLPKSTSIQTFEEVERITKICMEETKVDKNIVSKVLTDYIIPDDSKYGKFLACSYRKQKYLNEKGEIQFENIMRFLSRYYKKEDLEVLKVCGELKQTDNGADNALNTLKCILPKLLPIQEIFNE